MRFPALPLVSFLLPTLACAQSFTPVRELKNLSPEAIQKLHTLETLNALPGGEWRYHEGDLPHGESVSLDDSSWQTITAPADRKHYVKSTEEAVWFRRWIEVPKTVNGYDITGARVWFQFRADANGPMPEIIYFNGRRVALGDDLEPIILFEPAKPGDKVLVAVKLLHTVDKKTITGVNMRVQPLDPKRPNPDDIHMQAITAANLLPALPTPRKDLLPKVEEAIRDIDEKALEHADQRKFDASLEKAQSVLSEVAPAMQQAKVDLAGNAHIDAAWLWPASETVDVVKRTFSTALQLMNEYPDYTYSQSAAQYSAWMADKYPELNKQIAQRVKEGRWEIVGGMWIEPDLNLPGGESLVRQLLVGQKVFQDLYGVTARIGWNPDSFGYNWQLPQIYKRSGMDYFVTQKMHWNDTNQLPFRLFWWESPDGSKVLTYFPTDYVHDNVSPARISADFAESEQRNPGLTEHLDLYGIGDHGGGPTRDMLDQATHWIDAEKNGKVAIPPMQFHTAQKFFDDVEGKLNSDSPVWNYDKIAQGYTAPPSGGEGKVGIPTWKDELYFEYHRGIFTTQAKHKWNMRHSEQATIDTEKMASLAWLFGARYPQTELTENWKKITFNQFHDLAAGSGIAVIYRDSQKDYDEVFHSDQLMTMGAFGAIAPHIDTSGAGVGQVPLVVLNALPWERSGAVEVSADVIPVGEEPMIVDRKGVRLLAQSLPADGQHGARRVLVEASHVPSVGYTGYRLESGHAAQKRAAGGMGPVKVDDRFVELSNERLKVRIDKSNGCLSQLQMVDQHGPGFLAANGCGNQLQAFADNPKNYDAWNVDPGTLDKAPTIIDKVDSVKVVADGPLRKIVRIERTWQSSRFTQDISLDAGADTVVVDNTVDWHENHVLLKAAFPLAATSAKATYEIPYGSIQRPTTRDNTFSKAQFEVPALRWADLGDEKQGVSILNDAKYGYDALGNTLRITLLRAPTWPDAEADRGVQHFRYAIYPHMGTWDKAETIHRAYELNQPLVTEQMFVHAGSLPATHSFVSLEGTPNVVLTAVKKAEGNDALVFRMYEATGKASTVKLHIPHGATTATETNLMEKPEGAALSLANDVVTVAIKPYEILTVEASYPHEESR